jgi:hypothetical protein
LDGFEYLDEFDGSIFGNLDGFKQFDGFGQFGGLDELGGLGA